MTELSPNRIVELTAEISAVLDGLPIYQAVGLLISVAATIIDGCEPGFRSLLVASSIGTLNLLKEHAQ